MLSEHKGGHHAHPRVIPLIALCIVLRLPPPVLGDDQAPGLETYGGLIEGYLAGNSEDAIRAAGSWHRIGIESTVDRFLDWCRSAPDEAGQGRVRAAQGAFLLHTHTALANQARDHEAHVYAARRLLRWLQDRYDRAGPWPPEARGLTPRDSSLALASGALLLGRHKVTLELVDESLEHVTRDPVMRLLSGCAWEVEAYQRQEGGVWYGPASADRSTLQDNNEAPHP